MSVKHSILILLVLSLLRPGTSVTRKRTRRRALIPDQNPELSTDDESEVSEVERRVPPRRAKSISLKLSSPENLKSNEFEVSNSEPPENLHTESLENLHTKPFDNLQSKEFDDLLNKKLEGLKYEESEASVIKEPEPSTSREPEPSVIKESESVEIEEPKPSVRREAEPLKYSQTSVKFDRVTEMMSEHLSKSGVDSKKFCKYDWHNCTKFIEAYTRRCLAGDCYTLDNVPVVDLQDGLKVHLPFLNQYAFAMALFEDSGAWQKSKFYNIFGKIKNKIYGSDERTIESFNNKITRISFRNMDFGGDFNRMILTEVLYKASLHYLAYLSESSLAKYMNKWKFMRFFFRLKQTSWLTGAAKNIAKSKTLEMGMRDLQLVIDSYLLYLNVSGVVEPERLTISYSKLVKHSIMKVLGTKVVSALMSDYILTMPPMLNDFCKTSDDKNEKQNTVPFTPVHCRKMVSDYLERCQDGDCITLDTRTLLDGKDYLNVNLPDLDQLNAAVTIFVNSRAHKKAILDFIFRRKNRINQSQFVNKLYTENLKETKFNNRDHEVLGRYLYYDTLYFKIRSLKNRIRLFFSKKIETELKNFLQPLVKITPVRINKVKISLIFVAYRNYLFENNFAKDRDKLINFVQICHEVLSSFTDLMNLVGGKKKEKAKHLEPEEEELEKSNFDYELENKLIHDKEEPLVSTKSHKKHVNLENTVENMEEVY
ncbi:Rhoptry-associated protein 1 (RAP-1) family protein [Theileria parva strain Muguga]|uniref:Rhoptry-associated protein 1 n=1 Tax=Theileria parva TaxID=5875 RepID=Q4N7X0_THEPA|nr:Rhoptry-associated protein 1 (RAP-1) family protein [Theileria parva strain Muguga]EAN33938.1 Rhoptry-associated protein 1 (RAP-1) family protein [Theileria parva strain Muguga]|eukprot:XP_766221.1 hypothetical protein [Theileria parva strain Muguga]